MFSYVCSPRRHNACMLQCMKKVIIYSYILSSNTGTDNIFLCHCQWENNRLMTLFQASVAAPKCFTWMQTNRNPSAISTKFTEDWRKLPSCYDWVADGQFLSAACLVETKQLLQNYLPLQLDLFNSNINTFYLVSGHNLYLSV